MHNSYNRWALAALLAIFISNDAFAQPDDGHKAWDVSEQTEALTGAVTIAANRDSDGTVANMLGNPEAATLVLRCKESQLVSYIVWPQVLDTINTGMNGRAMVLWRLDDQPIKTDFWSVSDDGTAAGFFDSKNAANFIKKLVLAKRLAVRFTGENTQDAAFSLGDIADIANRVGTKCGLSFAAAPQKNIETANAAQVGPVSLSSAMEAAKRGSIGIAFSPSIVGAVILAVAPGSPADHAGLKAGETIEAVNGVSLKGMDMNASSALFSQLPNDFKAAVVGVGEILVTRSK